MVFGPFLFKVQVVIRNEMGQQLFMTEKHFLEILRVAENHGWNPMGTDELYSTQPSIEDYLPRGVDGIRTVSEKDAIGVHMALRIFGIRSGVVRELKMSGLLLNTLCNIWWIFFREGVWW